MGGGTHPNWAVCIGGPLDGRRVLLHPGLTRGEYVHWEPGSSPGRAVPHEYAVTESFVRVRVVRWVCARPECAAPVVEHGAGWGSGVKGSLRSPARE